MINWTGYYFGTGLRILEVLQWEKNRTGAKIGNLLSQTAHARMVWCHTRMRGHTQGLTHHVLMAYKTSLVIRV